MKIFWLLAFLLFLNASLLFSQDKTSISELKQKQWAFSFTVGTSTNGPAEDIETAMLQSNFDQTSSSGLFDSSDGTEHPFSNNGIGSTGFPWSLLISYSPANWYNIGLLVSHTKMGTTIGYHIDPDAFLEIQYSVFVISPIVRFTSFKFINLGIGPALFMNSAHQAELDNTKRINQQTKLGFIFEMNICVPATTRYFAEVNMQYRQAGKSKIGPFDTGYSNDLITLHKFTADYTHIYVGLGLGLRF